MKKIIFIIISILLTNTLFANITKENIEKEISGSWITEETYNYNKKHFNFHTDLEFKDYSYNTLIINVSNDNGIFWILDGSPQNIISYEIENNIIHLKLSYYKNGIEWYIYDIIWNEPNSITLKNEKKAETYYRMDGPDQNFIQKAVTNTENVKVFVKPSETSFSWGTFSKNSNLSIREKSDKPETINGETYYWYRVSNPKLPDGWVFGKYMTFVDEFEKEDVPEPIVKSVKKEEPVLSRLEVLQKIDFLSGNIIDDSNRSLNRNNSKEANLERRNHKKGIYSYKNNIYDKNKNLIVINSNEYYIPNKIQIGMTKKDFISIFGEPKKIENNQLIYYEKFGKIYDLEGYFIFNEEKLETIKIYRYNNY